MTNENETACEELRQEKLDEAIEETFPASDVPSLTDPCVVEKLERERREKEAA